MEQIRLNNPETLPMNGQNVLLFLHDGTVCNAWFSNVAPQNDAKDDGEYDWPTYQVEVTLEDGSAKTITQAAPRVMV